MGLHGFNGTQGEPGISNLSVCIVGEKTQQTEIKSANTAEVTVSHEHAEAGR